jgi:REP element-mobilizing transposase RayT
MKDEDSSSPDLHPGHHTIRLKGFDYTKLGFYFVTICTHQQKCVFGKVERSVVTLNRLGELVQNCWHQIPIHFTHTKTHEFVVMPNHIHGIVEICCQLGRSSAAPLQTKDRPLVAPGSLGAIIRSFKSAAAWRAHIEHSFDGNLWQRNYYEKALLTAKQLADAQAYILQNPKRWAQREMSV